MRFELLRSIWAATVCPTLVSFLLWAGEPAPACEYLSRRHLSQNLNHTKMCYAVKLKWIIKSCSFFALKCCHAFEEVLVMARPWLFSFQWLSSSTRALRSSGWTEGSPCSESPLIWSPRFTPRCTRPSSSLILRSKITLMFLCVHFLSFSCAFLFKSIQDQHLHNFFQHCQSIETSEQASEGELVKYLKVTTPPAVQATLSQNSSIGNNQVVTYTPKFLS